MTVRVGLVTFDVQGFAANTGLRLTVRTRPSSSSSSATTAASARGAAGAALWEAPAMKSTTRATTDEALRSCFEQFLADARVESPRWRREIAANAGGGPLASRAGQ